MQRQLQGARRPARPQPLANRELRDEKADSEKRAWPGSSSQQAREALDGQWHFDAESNQRQGERDRPDERASRHARQRTRDAAAPRIGKELEASDRDSKGNDVGRDRGECGRQGGALAVGDADKRDTKVAGIRKGSIECPHDAFAGRRVPDEMR